MEQGTPILESELTDSDILCGRGTKYCSHPGNKKYHSICKAHSNAYRQAKCKDEKTKITRTIVNNLRNSNPPSRFIQKGDKSNGSTGEVEWFDIGDRKAWEKTSQLLREIVSKGNHTTVYQKRKWDKELKRIEVRNAKKLKPETYKFPMAQNYIHRTRDFESTGPSPTFSPLTNSDTLALRTLPFHDRSPNTAQRLLGHPELLRLSTERPILRSPQNIIAPHLQASNLNSNPSFSNLLNNLQLRNQPINQSSITGPTPSALENQFHSGIDSLLSRNHEYNPGNGSSGSDVMRLWLDQNPTIQELENSLLLRRQIEANKLHRELLQRNVNVLASFSSAPPTQSPQDTNFTEMSSQTSSQKYNKKYVPKSVTPPVWNSMG